MTESDEFELNTADILDKIKDIVGDIILAAMKFSIKQAFIHFIRPKEGKVRLEYAFTVGIDLGDERLSVSAYAELQSMTFGIWNTENKKSQQKWDCLIFPSSWSNGFNRLIHKSIWSRCHN